MFSVMFDTNVYQKVLIPKTSKPANPICIIHNALKNKHITGYLSEVIFQIEAVRCENRKNFYEDYKPLSGSQEHHITNKEVCKNYSIKPSQKKIPPNSYLHQYLKVAKKLGVKIIRNNRIAMPFSSVPQCMFLTINDEKEYHKRNNKQAELQDVFEKKNIGFQRIKTLCLSNKKSEQPWFKQEWFDQLLYQDPKKVSKAFAEWADGDALSACYAHNIDYFCTEDKGISAQAPSVFSAPNKKCWKKNYGIKIVNILNLAKLLK